MTEVVWLSARYLGIGKALTKKNGMLCTIVVARYQPQGNVQGEFQENVLEGDFDNSICAKIQKYLPGADETVNEKKNENNNIIQTTSFPLLASSSVVQGSNIAQTHESFNQLNLGNDASGTIFGKTSTNFQKPESSIMTEGSLRLNLIQGSVDMPRNKANESLKNVFSDRNFKSNYMKDNQLKNLKSKHNEYKSISSLSPMDSSDNTFLPLADEIENVTTNALAAIKDHPLTLNDSLINSKKEHYKKQDNNKNINGSSNRNKNQANDDERVRSTFKNRNSNYRPQYGNHLSTPNLDKQNLEEKKKADMKQYKLTQEVKPIEQMSSTSSTATSEAIPNKEIPPFVNGNSMGNWPSFGFASFGSPVVLHIGATGFFEGKSIYLEFHLKLSLLFF